MKFVLFALSLIMYFCLLSKVFLLIVKLKLSELFSVWFIKLCSLDDGPSFIFCHMIVDWIFFSVSILLICSSASLLRIVIVASSSYRLSLMKSSNSSSLYLFGIGSLVVPKGPIDARGKIVLVSTIFWKVLLKKACGACVRGCKPSDLQI